MKALFSIRPPFILASQSPRRRALLNQMNLTFDVQPSPADETLPSSVPPPEQARRLAARKAAPVADAHPSALVLAADTIVIHEDTVLEKPASPADAIDMLKHLSDTTHSVYTGLALHHAETQRTAATGAETRVTFADLTPQEIEAYVDTGSPMDKAGGYGIQDHTAPLFIDRLNGDYYNVVGLPLRLLYRTLLDHFSDLLDR